MKIIDDTKKIVDGNVYFVKAYLKGLKFRNCKSGLYIYGRYTTHYISKLDLMERDMLRKNEINFMLDNIKNTELKEII